MITPLRVLIVEDVEDDAALIVRELRRGGYEAHFARVDAAATFSAALATEAWDLILADHVLPQFGALEALKLTQASQSDLPFIIVSGAIGEDIAVAAMRAGAHDCIMKSHLARLVPAVERELREAKVRRERRRAEAALRESEDRYRDLVEHSHDLICTHDLAGHILSVNQMAARSLGYEQDELLKKDLRDVLAPEARDQFDGYLATIRQHGVASGLMLIQTGTGEKRIWAYRNTLRTTGVPSPIVRGMAHDVTERKRAERALHHRAKELAALHATALDITAPHQLPTLLHTIVERAVHLLGGHGGGLFLCEPERREIRCVVSYRTRHNYVGAVLRYGEGLGGRVAETGAPLAINDYHAWPDRMEFVQEGPALAAVLCVPMIWQGQVTGVIQVLQQDGSRQFTPADQELLTLFANQAAIAVENARLLEAERGARRQAETLCAANLALTQSLDLDAILATLLDYLGQLVPYDSASVMLVEPDSHLAAVCATRGYERWTDPELTRRIRFDLSAKPWLLTLMKTQQSILLADIETEPDWERVAGSEHIRNWLGVPLVVNGQVIGLYSLDKTTPGFFTKEHRRLAEALAAQAAVTIQNARLHQQVQRRLQELTAVYQASQRLQQLSTLEALAQAVIQVLEETLEYDYGAVLFIDELTGRLVPFALSNRWRDTVLTSVSHHRLAAPGMRLGFGITGWVAQTGESVRLGDARQDPRYYQMRAESRSELCVPLRAGHQIIGVVNVESPQLHAYTEADQRVLETIAAHIATAVQNARLYEQVRGYAAELEQRVSERKRAEARLRESREQLRNLAARLQSVREEERAHIAREIHDELGQSLTGLKMDLAWLASRLPEDQPWLREKPQDMRRLIDATIQTVRKIATELRPGILDDLGLTAAIEWQAQEFQARTGIACEFISRLEEFPLERDRSTAIFRIFQETLTNVARHAQATRVSVSLRAHNGSLVLEVRDNGKGVTAEELADPQSLGLLGMRERALLFGGEVSISGQPGAGTTVTAQIPLLHARALGGTA
jgi:PAS domain S-box-containing protein